MSLSQKIAQNSFIQIAGRIFSTLLSLASIFFITRYLGPEGFGRYTIIIAFLSFFGIIADMGIYLTALQMISEPGRDSAKLFSNAFTMRVIISAIFLALAPLVALLFPYPLIVKKGIAIAVFAFFFISMCQILHAVFQKELKMFKAELSEIFGKASILICVALAIYFKLNLLYLIGCLVVGNLINFLVKFAYAKRHITIKFAFDKEIWQEIISKSWPIALSIVFNLVYLRGDIIILSLFASEAQVGFYGASYKVLDVLTTLPIVFAGLMMPIFTKTWAEKNFDHLKKYLQISFDICAIISIPIILGTQFIATAVMVLAAGHKFAPSGDILRVLVIAVNMIFFGTMFGHMIVAINKQKTMLFGYLATAIIAIIGYFIFIPRFSVYGAAWITVFSETLVALIALTLIYKTTKILPNLKRLSKALLAGLIMSLVLYTIRDANMLILILTGAIIYTGTLYFTGGIDKRMIKSLAGVKN